LLVSMLAKISERFGKCASLSWHSIPADENRRNPRNKSNTHQIHSKHFKAFKNYVRWCPVHITCMSTATGLTYALLQDLFDLEVSWLEASWFVTNT
jgi:hypothetical protein